MLATAAAALQAAGDRGPMSHARWRPEAVELASAAECLELARADRRAARARALLDAAGGGPRDPGARRRASP